MAQTISTAAASRINRRFLLLSIILGALAAILIYAWMSRSDSGGGAAAGDVPVVVAKSAIAAGSRITAEMVEIKEFPESNVPFEALSATDAVIGQVTRYPIAAGEQVLSSKLVGATIASNDVLSYVLEEGKRGMAIRVEQVTGAGGLVLPGDHVDVFAIPEDLVGQDHPGAFLLAENVEVIAVEQTLAELPPSAPGLREQGAVPSTDTERVRGAEGKPQPEAITVTLMLTPEQASNIFCGDQLGVLRLAVRAFGDESASGLPIEACIIDAAEQQ